MHTATPRKAERCVRRTRRKLVLRGAFLSRNAFCRRAGISGPQLVRKERRGRVLSVPIGGKRFYPAVLADKSLDQRRITKLLRRLPPTVPPIVRFDFLVSRRCSLGDKPVMQAMRRGKRYRIALRLADSIASEYGRGGAYDS